MRILTHYPDAFPEPWASDWGDDEYGLWMAFTYKGIKQCFRWIEPGTFMMGSPKNEAGRLEEELQHQVTLTKGFWLADTTVTQALWQAVIGYHPSALIGEQRPVDRIGWEHAHAFISKLNDLKPELKLCLPSEAQWEYACRAGTQTPFYFGDKITSELVNFNGNPDHYGERSENREVTVKVKSFPPNPWGLYEMHGNVWEWCQDWFGDYPPTPVTDPVGPETGDRRVLRGGAFRASGERCRSAARNRDPLEAIPRIGFRLARGH